MKLRDAKIGYWPNRPTGDAAGDRRRFTAYAKERGLSYEIASPSKRYDVVYLTTDCNNSDWVRYKQAYPETKLIFAVVDTYITRRPHWSNQARGLVRYLTGRESRYFWDYRNAFLKMASLSDAVVCSTREQQEMLAMYNRSIHISLDFFEDDIKCCKSRWDTGGKLRLVWEGQAYTVSNLLIIRKALAAVTANSELHIVTDLEIKHPLTAFNRSTRGVLKNLDAPYCLHEWTRESFSRIITESDLAIIPIDPHSELMRGKPENKLLLFWQLGLPVLAADTPAYRRVLETAGLRDYCCAEGDWEARIRTFQEKTTKERIEDMGKARRYLDENHRRDIIFSRWDDIFRSVGFDCDWD